MVFGVGSDSVTAAAADTETSTAVDNVVALPEAYLPCWRAIRWSAICQHISYINMQGYGPGIAKPKQLAVAATNTAKRMDIVEIRQEAGDCA